MLAPLAEELAFGWFALSRFGLIARDVTWRGSVSSRRAVDIRDSNIGNLARRRAIAMSAVSDREKARWRWDVERENEIDIGVDKRAVFNFDVAPRGARFSLVESRYVLLFACSATRMMKTIDEATVGSRLCVSHLPACPLEARLEARRENLLRAVYARQASS